MVAVTVDDVTRFAASTTIEMRLPPCLFFASFFPPRSNPALSPSCVRAAGAAACVRFHHGVALSMWLRKC